MNRCLFQQRGGIRVSRIDRQNPEANGIGLRRQIHVEVDSHKHLEGHDVARIQGQRGLNGGEGFDRLSDGSVLRQVLQPHV